MANFRQELDLAKAINFGESIYFFQELTNQVDAFFVPKSGGTKHGYGNAWTSNYVGQALNGQIEKDGYFYEMDPSLRFSNTTGQGAGKESVINMNYFSLKIGNDPKYNNITYAKMYNYRLMEEWLTPRDQIEKPKSNYEYWKESYPFVTMNINENSGPPGYWRGWNSADKPGNPQIYENARGLGSYKKEKFDLHYEPYDLNVHSLKARNSSWNYPQLVIYNKRLAEVTPRLQALGEAQIANGQGNLPIKLEVLDSFKYTPGQTAPEYKTEVTQTVSSRITQTAGLIDTSKTSSYRDNKFNISGNFNVGIAAPSTGGPQGGIGGSAGYERSWGIANEQLRELSSSQSKEDTLEVTKKSELNVKPDVSRNPLTGKYKVVYEGQTKTVKKGDQLLFTILTKNTRGRLAINQPVKILEQTRIDKNISPAVSMFWSNANNTDTNVTQKGYGMQLDDFGRKVSRPIQFYRNHNGLTMDNLDESIDVGGGQTLPTLEFDDNSGEWTAAAVYSADVKLTGFAFDVQLTEITEYPQESSRNRRKLELINLSDIDTNDEIGSSFQGTKSRDVIHASFEGGDIIDLGEGGDRLINPVDSVVYTGAGQDVIKLNARSHRNTIDAGSGSDSVLVKGSSNCIFAGSGSDRIIDKGTANTIDISGDSARDTIVFGGTESSIYGFDPGEDILSFLRNKQISVNLYGNEFIDIHDKVTGLKLTTLTLDPTGIYDVRSRDSIFVSLVAGGAKTSDSAGMIEDYFDFSINNDRFAEKFVELGGLSHHFKDYKELGLEFIQASRSQSFLERLNTSVREGLLDAGIELEQDIIASKLIEITEDIRQSGTASVDDASAYAAQGFLELIYSTMPSPNLA